ncbi:MAG: hypothetical protein RL414_961 [Actinomycetota bacterium]|jgi:hypothetical protein
MRSEIPQLEVVTAIGDAELEDYVSQLLFTQGWSIIFRAFDSGALTEFLTARTPELRTVVVFTTDLPQFTSKLVMDYSSTAMTFINLDGVSPTAHEIMQKIRGQLRLPLVHGTSASPQGLGVAQPSESYPKIEANPNKVILVTGTSGAPGKTLFTVAAAEEISHQRKTLVVDADFRSIPLENYYPASNFAISRLDQSEKPTELPEGENKSVTIVDVGVLPSLNEVVNDRRWQATLHNKFLESATHMVYVAKSTKASLMQLDQFKRELPILMKKIPITYILVTDNGSKELRQAQEAFAKITSGEKSYIVRESSLHPARSGKAGTVDQLLSFGASGKAKKEIGSIATSLM